MNWTRRVATIGLAVVFCAVLVQPAISERPMIATDAEPTWKIFKEGTNQSVQWEDADNPRFAIHDGMVLDKSTGLIWEQFPAQSPKSAIGPAVESCYWNYREHRYWGWRLPTFLELQSLIVMHDGSTPWLPDGHPFTIEIGHVYPTKPSASGFFGIYIKRDGMEIEYYYTDKNTMGPWVHGWCVRGGN